MRIQVDKTRKESLYWQITDALRRAILNGELADGSMLPSERKLAEQLGVHRNTVIRAYSALKDMELISSWQGKGYVVGLGPDAEEEGFGMAARGSASAGEQASSKDGKRKELHRNRAVNWANIIKDEYLDMKEEFDHIFTRFYEGDGISFAAGMPPFLYSEREIGQDIAEILVENRNLPALVAPYQGDMDLLRQLRSYLRTKGISVGLSQLQVLAETNQALDFIITTLTSPGDCVIIEEPCSPDVYRVIELAGCTPISIPMDLDGMITEGLADIIEKRHPKFIYVNSSYHDPTGEILSTARRKQLLDLSNHYGIPIVEEDAASELYYEDKAFPTIKSMDKNNNVIYIYSFQVSFVPGISLAVMAADSMLIHSMQYLVSIRVISISWITQKLLARYLKNGTYLQKVEEMVRHNRRNRDIMCVYLDQLSDIGVTYRKPRGGVYIWVQLPAGLQGRAVVEAAAKEHVALMPGEVFYAMGRGGKDAIRLNFSYESSEWLQAGMERLVNLIQRMHDEQK